MKVVCPAGNSTPFVTATASISLAPTPVLPCKIVYPLSVQVACSFDPNDKQVLPRGCGFEGLILREELLTYSIQFQNLGSGPAHRVIIRDTLDPSLDLASLQLESSSHAYLFEVNGRELIWTFPNIQLPAASVDEPGSHGYVRFQVRPDASAAAGTPIFNTAGIYFDLNSPVFTATTYNTITEDPQPMAAFAMSRPDPNDDALVNFTYTGGTAGAQFRWDFGAGAQPQTSTAANPTGIAYATPGLKQAVLQVTLGGCVAEPAVQVFSVGRPVLRARLDGTQVILEWTGPGFALQETDALTTPVAWQNSALPVTSQTVNGEVRQQAAADASGIGSRKFFRLAE